MVKQISLDTWSIQHLTDLLHRCAIIVSKTNTPMILYRRTMEEEDGSYEEVVCTLTHDHVIEQLVTSGGVLPPNFHQQYAYRIDDFPDRLLRKSKELFLHTVETLENELK